MTYVIVEWEESRAVSVINRAWLTPLKKEAFWPPCKEQKVFNKIIIENDPVIDKSWVLHVGERCMYETDNLKKALEKCKEAEDTSNLESDSESTSRNKRKLRAKKILSSSDEDENITLGKRKKQNPERPPRFSFNNLSNSQESSCTSECTSISSVVSSNSLNPRIIRPNCVSNTFSESRNLTSPLRVNTETNCTYSSTPTYQSRDTLNESTLVGTNSSSLGLDHKVLSLLYHIREQNDQILNHLDKKATSFGAGELPSNFPIKLPIRQLEQFDEMESFLKLDINFSGMVSYLSSLGGKDSISKTNRILKHVLTDEVASFFNFRGKRQKRPFGELLLNEAVIRAVKKSINVTNTEVEAAVKVWLKHAPQRFLRKNC